MHFECFQVHFHTLQSSHSSGYAGKQLPDHTLLDVRVGLPVTIASKFLPLDKVKGTQALLFESDASEI